MQKERTEKKDGKQRKSIGIRSRSEMALQKEETRTQIQKIKRIKESAAPNRAPK